MSVPAAFTLPVAHTTAQLAFGHFLALTRCASTPDISPMLTVSNSTQTQTTWPLDPQIRLSVFGALSRAHLSASSLDTEARCCRSLSPLMESTWLLLARTRGWSCGIYRQGHCSKTCGDTLTVSPACPSAQTAAWWHRHPWTTLSESGTSVTPMEGRQLTAHPVSWWDCTLETPATCLMSSLWPATCCWSQEPHKRKLSSNPSFLFLSWAKQWDIAPPAHESELTCLL